MSRAELKVFLLLLFLPIVGGAQDIKPDIKVRGGFTSDSLRVGDEIFYYLTTTSPQHVQLIYPDSSFNYSPFEFKRKRYFITQTKNGVSKDSAVYHLSTFEVDSIQLLRLPVFQVNSLDCTRFYTSWDTVRLQMMVKKLPEKITSDLPVRATIAYQPVDTMINYPVIIVIGTLLLLLCAIFWFAFGNEISLYLKIRRMKKAHAQFLNAFNTKIEKLTSGFSRIETENAVLLWKVYMEQVNRFPYTRLTTSEMQKRRVDLPIINPLKRLDEVIYGYSEQTNNSLVELRDYANDRFQSILMEEKKNG